MRARLTPNIGAGSIFILFGSFLLWEISALPLGTASRMGPAYVPSLLCVLLVLVGAILVIMAIVRHEGDGAAFPWRPFVLIPVSILSFALLIRNVGLLGSCFVTAVLSSVSAGEFRWVEAILLALSLSAGSAVVFSYLLGLHMPILPAFHRLW